MGGTEINGVVQQQYLKINGWELYKADDLRSLIKRKLNLGWQSGHREISVRGKK